MLATKQVTGSPIVGFHLRHKHDDLIVVIESGITVWKINRDVHYNVVRGGHTGPVISLYTCSGGKVIQKKKAASTSNSCEKSYCQ